MGRPPVPRALLLCFLVLPGGCLASGASPPPTTSAGPGAPASSEDSADRAEPLTGISSAHVRGSPPPEGEWRLHHSDGSEAGLEAVVARASEVDVIFVGERHGNAGTHALQLRLLSMLIEETRAEGRELVLGLEMFERDVQPVLDEYLAELITEEHFLSVARPWPNYSRDYRPVVEMARKEGIRVLATNTPRRYADRVSRLGPEALEALPSEARRHLPPLPFPGPSEAYRAEWEARMDALTHGHGASHEGQYALVVQALWDASMAHSIHEALEARPSGTDEREGQDPPSPLVLHLTGTFHVENRTGVPEALRHYRPSVRDLVVTAWPVDTPKDFEAATGGVTLTGLADFVALTPRDRLRDP